MGLPGFVVENVVDNEEVEVDSENDASLEDLPIDSNNEKDLLTHLPEHGLCFTHTLQNAIKNGFKTAGNIDRVIARASSIVSFVRKST